MGGRDQEAAGYELDPGDIHEHGADAYQQTAALSRTAGLIRYDRYQNVNFCKRLPPYAWDLIASCTTPTIPAGAPNTIIAKPVSAVRIIAASRMPSCSMALISSTSSICLDELTLHLLEETR